MKLALSKYPGGKTPMLPYLYNIFDWAECSVFIDACCGMGSVCLNLPDKYKTIIANDKDLSINNLWKHFQDKQLFTAFKAKLEATTYDLDNHWKAKEIYAYYYKYSMLEFAWATVVCHRFSRNAMPKNVFQRAGRLRGGQNECINAWESYLKNLQKIHEATQRVIISSLDIVKLLQRHRDKETLIYADVPYPFDTRTTQMYRTEMPDTKHQSFLTEVKNHPSKIVISGRPNEMYEYNLIDWKIDIRQVTNHMSHRKKKVKNPEVVWSNYEWNGKYYAF